MKSLLIFLLFLPLKSFCQNSSNEFINNEWFIYQIVSDGEVYDRPFIDNISTSNLYMLTEQNNLIVRYCNETCGGGGQENYVLTDDAFHFTEYVCLIDGCNNQIELPFLWQYRDFFWFETNTIFQYQINELESGIKQLIVTNVNGDQAYFYSTHTVSNPNFNKDLFKVYPNPVIDTLSIDISEISDKNLQLYIYNLNGKILKKSNLVGGEILNLDISEFPKSNIILLIKKDNNVIYNQILSKK